MLRALSSVLSGSFVLHLDLMKTILDLVPACFVLHRADEDHFELDSRLFCPSSNL